MKLARRTITITFLLFLIQSYLNPFSLQTLAQEEEEPVFRAGLFSISSIDSFDPVLYTNTPIKNVVYDNVLEGLFKWNFFSKTYDPVLAQSYFFVNSTSLYIILKQDILFQDGTPFNATAAKWNIERCINLSQQFNTSTLYNFWIQADNLINFLDQELSWVPPGKMIPIINKTTVWDEYVILIEFNIPQSEPPNGRHWSMISPSFHAEYENEPIPELYHITDLIVGTGPFRLLDWDMFEGVLYLERNDFYWGEIPAIDVVLIFNFFDKFSLLNAFFNGEIDYVIYPSDFNKFKDYYRYDESIIFFNYGENGVYQSSSVIVMPLTHHNVTLRKALSYSIDYSSILGIYPENCAIRSSGLFPRNNKYNNPSISLPDFNLTKARQLLIDGNIAPSDAGNWTDEEWIGVADTVPIYQFNFHYSQFQSDIYDVFKWSGKLIGINITGTLVSDFQYYEYFNNTTLLSAVESYLMTIYSKNPDPRDNIRTNFNSEEINVGNLSNSEIDYLTWYWYTLTDYSSPNVQNIADSLADKIQNEIIPVIWLTHEVKFALLSPYWMGDPGQNLIELKNIERRPYEPEHAYPTGSVPLFIIVVFLLIIVGAIYLFFKCISHVLYL